MPIPQVYPEYVVLYSRRPRASPPCLNAAFAGSEGRDGPRKQAVALETFKFELGGELHAELPVFLACKRGSSCTA